MLVLHLPQTFSIGDTADCKINFAPAKVTWRDAGTLVLVTDEDGESVRSISRHFDTDNGLQCFVCGDPGDVVITPNVTII